MCRCSQYTVGSGTLTDTRTRMRVLACSEFLPLERLLLLLLEWGMRRACEWMECKNAHMAPLKQFSKHWDRDSGVLHGCMKFGNKIILSVIKIVPSLHRCFKTQQVARCL